MLQDLCTLLCSFLLLFGLQAYHIRQQQQHNQNTKARFSSMKLTLKLLSPPLRTETPEPVLCYAARTALKPTAPHVFTGELNFFKNLLQVTH